MKIIFCIIFGLTLFLPSAEAALKIGGTKQGFATNALVWSMNRKGTVKPVGFLLPETSEEDSVKTVPVTKDDPATNQPHWNLQAGVAEINLLRSPKGESTMNNLVCDIMLTRTNTDFAFINFGDIYADYEPGPIGNLDLFRLVPFNRTLVVLEVTGEFLKRLVEQNISGIRQGMAIAGGKVEYDVSRPNNSRLNYFQVGNYPCYPLKDYRVVTTDYLLAGNAGFDLLTTVAPEKIIRTEILLRDAIREFIQLNSPLNARNVKLDGRWEKRISTP
jgi:5'-nucleotidase/UDP-sugar diphosphatase